MNAGSKLAVAAGILLVASIVGSFSTGIAYGESTDSCGPPERAISAYDAEVAAAQFVAGFSPEEWAPKQEIINTAVGIGQERGFTPCSIAINIGTGIQESNLTNHGDLGENNDHDSHGYLQQQWTQGWGTLEETMDVVHATHEFYDRLQNIPDRDQRPMMDVAMQVQNPNRDAYARRWAWDAIAIGLVARVLTAQQAPSTEVAEPAIPEPATSPDAPATPQYRLSEMFGLHSDNSRSTWWYNTGIDITVSASTPVYAVEEGTVTHTSVNGTDSTVVIENSQGISLVYRSLSGLESNIQKGTVITAGQPLGLVGSEKSKKVRLHLEVIRDGDYVDPTTYLTDLKVLLVPVQH